MFLSGYVFIAQVSEQYGVSSPDNAKRVLQAIKSGGLEGLRQLTRKGGAVGAIALALLSQMGVSGDAHQNADAPQA
jgi:hypothetical protein